MEGLPADGEHAEVQAFRAALFEPDHVDGLLCESVPEPVGQVVAEPDLAIRHRVGFGITPRSLGIRAATRQKQGPESQCTGERAEQSLDVHNALLIRCSSH